MEASSMAGYANPDVLVSTDWVDEHKADPNVRLVEVDVDTEAYETGHIPGAVGWNWQSQLQDGLGATFCPRRTSRPS
jgi:thiosulfate/3-mercaptopyruvate sulfurtransferase